MPHDIPDEIVLNGFVKPEGERLTALVRVPLVMLLSIDLPKRGPGYLALDRIGAGLEQAIEITAREIALYESGLALSHSRAVARISQPSDESFESYEAAITSFDGPPLDTSENVFWNQGYLDIRFEYPIRSERSEFALDFRVAPGLPGRLKMVVRYLPPGGAVRAYTIHGGFGRLALDPRWHQAARTFVSLGFEHILDGIDHLLFLLCLVLPFGLRHFWPLAGVITAFTLGHTVTLIAAATGGAPEARWFPPLVESLIAFSILFMAVENAIVMARGRGALTDLRWRWLMAGVFGLVHGFGFSFVLQEDLQFAGAHFLLSLIAFNVGVELGQLLVLAFLLPALGLVLRHPPVRRIGVLVISIFVGHTAWHWLVERGGTLRLAAGSELEIERLLSWFPWAMGSAVIAVLATWLIWRIVRGQPGQWLASRAMVNDRTWPSGRGAQKGGNSTSVGPSGS